MPYKSDHAAHYIFILIILKIINPLLTKTMNKDQHLYFTQFYKLQQTVHF